MSKDDNEQKDATLVPGARWRVLAHDGTQQVELENRGILDEVVLGNWFHLEQLDDRTWWIRVGDARILAHVGQPGPLRVDVVRGFYEPVLGETRIHEPPT